MPDYRCAWHPGGTYFFTVNLLKRHDNDLLTRHVDGLREIVRLVRKHHPFRIHGWVVLPDHLHCVIELTPGDADFATRWRLIKMGFSKSLPRTERLSQVRAARGERGIWQRRYWEHLIRDEADFQGHMDYVHIKPLKHGLVERVADCLIRHFIGWLKQVFIHETGRAGMKPGWQRLTDRHPAQCASLIAPYHPPGKTHHRVHPIEVSRMNRTGTLTRR